MFRFITRLFGKRKKIEVDIDAISKRKWPGRSFGWPEGYIRPALEISFSKIIGKYSFIFEKEDLLKNETIRMTFSYDRGMIYCSLSKVGSKNYPEDLRHIIYEKYRQRSRPNLFDIPGLPEGQWGSEFQQLERLAYVLESIAPEILLGKF